ncbi:hypothetical protein OXYTRIMIC_076 [Oxytricha trifallax]|uniref:Uncharacterized protein n=1 Tax=Oxytricha trifallax TaxID=1172189 RepID=A0A073HYF4_9SPIT|nr:hypothetical protein OXYTRIMIC_076 [Oxytricha trifallax]
MLAIRPDNPPESKRDAFKREWYRIMKGEKVIRQGGNRRLIKSSRKSVRKDRRTNPHNQGNKQQRSNKQSLPISTPRKPRADQLIGKRADRGKDMDAKQALLDSTQKARDKRSQAHKDQQMGKLDNIQAEHVLMMKKTKFKLEKMLHYTSAIANLDVLPFPDDVQ